MTIKRESNKERDEAIRKEFSKRTKQKHLDSDHVVNELAKERFLKPSTVWRIVKKTGYYKSDKNTSDQGQ